MLIALENRQQLDTIEAVFLVLFFYNNEKLEISTYLLYNLIFLSFKYELCL